MIRAVGLDLSCARTGVARVDGTTLSIKSTAGPDDPARRLHIITSAIAHILNQDRPQIAVLEGYNPHGYQGLTMARLAELGGTVRLELFMRAIPYVEIAPSALKLFATGHGSATKDAMVDRARRLAADITNDDEADAWWLRAAALQHYQPRADWPALTPRLATMPWPDLKEPSRA